MFNVLIFRSVLIGSAVIAGGGVLFAATNPPPLDNITSLPPASSGDPAPVAGSNTNPAYLITSPAVAVPEPSNLSDFVIDKGALLRLGKSLFWDQQLGSDGVQACASCHFNAGADSRTKNQVSPGVKATPVDTTFQVGTGPNHQLTQGDYPFFQLTNPNIQGDAVDANGNALNSVLRNVNDVTSSQGVFSSTLIRTVPGHPADTVTYTQDGDGFQVAGADVRRVEPRNAPTVINSVFSRLQFWDGRAKEVFNGVNINGAGDTTALVIKATNPTSLAQVSVAIPNSSIASLVTGPPQSVFEMSAAGRNLHQIGSKFFDRILKKIRMLRPLNLQTVHPLDSVLGGVYSRSPKTGLAIASYDLMIQAAFNRVWWQSTMLISVAADGTPTWVPANSVRTVADNQFTLMEYNFGLFAGLAIEKYLSTLVADQTPFDKYQAGDTTALTADQIAGLGIFVKATNGTVATPGNNGGGNCNTCHTIPEFTRGSVRRTAGTNSTDNGDPLINGGANGFFTNYAVPAVNDQGAPQTPTPAVISSRFRAPTLRNIELTAPYFHNGGEATLEQVVDFYNRGRGDGVGASNSPTRAAVAAALGLTVTQKAQLVAFLKSLTDERVRKEQAPFDHPSMKIPNGQRGTEFSVVSQNLPDWPIAYDLFSNIPAVGAAGVTTTQSKFFDNLAKP